MAGMVRVRILSNEEIEFVDSFQGLETASPLMVNAIKARYQGTVPEESIQSIVVGVFTMIALSKIENNQDLVGRVIILDFSEYEKFFSVNSYSGR